MDWRLIAAVGAAVGACGLVGVVAVAVISDSSGPKAKASPGSLMLAERGAGGSLGAAFDTSNVILGPNNSPIVGPRGGSVRLASLGPSDVDAQTKPTPANPPIKITAPPPPKDTSQAAAPSPASPSSGASSALKPNLNGVLTPGEIARIKSQLRLTPDQEPLWPPVQGALSEMGRQQMALAMRGQKPENLFC